MKEQTKNTNTRQSSSNLYKHIELVPDEHTNTQNVESSEHTNNSKENSSTNVISDKYDSKGFNVDWDTIEENYKHSHSHHRHQSHHSGSHHHSSRHGHGRRHRRRKWKKWKKILVGILLFILCIIIGVVAAFFLMRHRGKEMLLNYDNMSIDVPEELNYEDDGDIIYYDGNKYRFNRDIASILFMGVDNRVLKENASAGTAGQADALYLLTYDTVNGKIKVLCLNRDTITDISRYSREGTYYDTAQKQLCLAYAYGDGKKLSAENQTTAVQRLLYNIPINGYYAIDLSALQVLNDDIGGVTVTPEYTFKEFKKGETVTLKGEMAEAFVRHRDYTLLDDNLRRMACQRQYLDAFADQIVPAIKKDLSLPLKLYEDSSEYTVTNIRVSDLTYLASELALDYSGMEFIKTSGEYKMVEGDKSAHFIVDKDKLFETVLDIFYLKVD